MHQYKHNYSHEELETMYRESLGSGSTTEFIDAVSRPEVGILLGITTLLAVSAGILMLAPELGIGPAIILGFGTTSVAGFYCLYLMILLELFFEDRFAFLLCILGLVGVPFVAFIYLEEIGPRKVYGAIALFTLSSVSWITFFQLTPEIPAAVSGLIIGS